jgi:hypothetical protein
MLEIFLTELGISGKVVLPCAMFLRQTVSTPADLIILEIFLFDSTI